MRNRKKWFSVHRWLGIGLGLWFALVGLTGSLLVFEDPIDAWLNPDLMTTADRGPWLAPDVIAGRATDDYALGKVERIRLPLVQGEVYRLFIRTSPNRRVGSERIEAFFHPVTGALLGSRGAETLGLSSRYVLKTLYEFHRNVLLGNTGSNIVGIAGFLLLANAITGLVVAWPRKREGFKRLVWINLRGNATRIFFDVHRSAGALFFVLLVLATVTGSTLVYVNYVRDLVNVFSKVASFPTVPWVAGTREEPRSFSDIVGAVHVAFPDGRITEIHGPPGRAGGYLFYLRRAGDEHRLGDTILWVHPMTARILVERSDRTRTGGEALMHWLFPLHSGTAFGTGGMVAMSATGAMPILLVLTGLWVWLRKRRGERIGRERREARRQAAAALPTAAE
jgi:uncharacterized iron-regulated membrane protein